MMIVVVKTVENRMMYTQIDIHLYEQKIPIVTLVISLPFYFFRKDTDEFIVIVQILAFNF